MWVYRKIRTKITHPSDGRALHCKCTSKSRNGKNDDFHVEINIREEASGGIDIEGEERRSWKLMSIKLRNALVYILERSLKTIK